LCQNIFWKLGLTALPLPFVNLRLKNASTPFGGYLLHALTF